MTGEPKTITIDPDKSAPPPYEQIRSQIAAMIVAGHLPPGHALPTIRDLAGDLRIAPGTVTRAYKELESEGLVVMAGRRGTIVTTNLPTGLEVPPDLDQAARELIANCKAHNYPLERIIAHLHLIVCSN